MQISHNEWICPHVCDHLHLRTKLSNHLKKKKTNNNICIKIYNESFHHRPHTFYILQWKRNTNEFIRLCRGQATQNTEQKNIQLVFKWNWTLGFVVHPLGVIMTAKNQFHISEQNNNALSSAKLHYNFLKSKYRANQSKTKIEIFLHMLY